MADLTKIKINQHTDLYKSEQHGSHFEMEDILKKKMATFKMAAKLNISISQLVIKNKVK